MFRHNMFWKKWILQEVTGNTCLAFPYENIAAETKQYKCKPQKEYLLSCIFDYFNQSIKVCL